MSADVFYGVRLAVTASAVILIAFATMHYLWNNFTWTWVREATGFLAFIFVFVGIMAISTISAEFVADFVRVQLNISAHSSMRGMSAFLGATFGGWTFISTVYSIIIVDSWMGFSVNRGGPT